MQVDKFTFFGSFYEAMKMLPEDQQQEFVMGILAYAFDGVEPGFDGALAAMFALAKPNIDSSVNGVINGSKGGRPNNGKTKGETKDKTQSETKGKNPPAKPPQETNKDMDMDREVDKEGEVSFSLEKTKPSPAASDGAEADESAPPSATKPVCPVCESAVTFNAKSAGWECPVCGAIKEPRLVPWKEAS